METVSDSGYLREMPDFAEFPEDFDQADFEGADFVEGQFDGEFSSAEFPSKADLEMSYSEWTVGLDSGPSHWLPAYGFQQPSAIQEALLHQHDSFNDGSQGYVYLETIMEETSDDLRSESDYSGWHDSDSGSVIHLPNKVNIPTVPADCVEGDWSGSERDLAVPKKRRRRQNEDPGVHDDEDALVSRSSSLVQFETLEKHCEHSFSYDSLDQARWPRYSDSLESSSEENLARSFSSSSYKSGLRSTRSYDSLVTQDRSHNEALSGEFSQSLNDNSLTTEEEPEPLPPPGSMYQTVECLDRVGAGPKPPKKSKRSSENLSEDSGFGEHIPAKSGGEPWPKYSGWQSAPDLAARDPLQLAASLLAFTIRDDEESLIVPENKYVMESKIPATSTPNLYNQDSPDGETLLKFGDSTVSLSRALSFKKNFEMEGMFSKASSKGSNIQITTSFVSLGGPGPKGDVPEAGPLQAKEGEVERGEETRLESAPVAAAEPPPAPHMETKTKTGRLGGFFQRFSLRRLSGKDKKRKEKKKEALVKEAEVPKPPPEDAVRIIPLHGPDPSTKPPLPPRKRDTPAPGPPIAASSPLAAPSVMSTRSPAGLLETDIDSETTSCSPGKKARSLLSLGRACPQPPTAPTAPDNRAKSMEFLLDKENHQQAKPPENELQKVGERVMSEHELRVQRSLQRLNLPDWYRNCPALPQQGFLLGKRGSDAAAHWPGLGSKTTSLSSLGSTQSAAATPRSPTTGHLLSPSPTPSGGVGGFTRWSTSRLNSSPNSASTSPCGSARSSFNYRQPYLGWRSQERIARPRTPAERLAAGLLPLKQQHQNVPNLSEVHTSIKEVTSAIANYVSKGDDRLSPALHRHDHASSRSASPRGSKTQLCWLESSFVGSKPLEVPETPMTATPPRAADLRLDLTPSTSLHSKPAILNGVGCDWLNAGGEECKPSPGSTTMEDVLDSLLGLPIASRSPSPARLSNHPILRSCGDINHLPESASIGSEEFPSVEERRHSEDREQHNLSSRKTAFEQVEGDTVKCRYTKCGKVAPLAEARKTFKTCHNCTHVYCSRECRRSHWEKHRKTCLHSRVGALCRKVLSAIKEDEESLYQVSLMARRGFLSRGRGAVKVFFSSTDIAEAYLNEGSNRLGDPTFIRWADLSAEESGPEMHEELLRLCKSYNPDSRVILLVSVCVVSEVPTTGAVKWERQLVSRCAKIRVSKRLAPQRTEAPETPDTLILTSLPGNMDSSKKSRQISFTNIQRNLRQHGVSLRKQFPDLYNKLCDYVEGTVERFVPVTVYPQDAATGKTFMCIIMPDSEPEKLDFLSKDSNSITKTIDISIDPDAENKTTPIKN